MKPLQNTQNLCLNSIPTTHWHKEAKYHFRESLQIYLPPPFPWVSKGATITTELHYSKDRLFPNNFSTHNRTQKPANCCLIFLDHEKGIPTNSLATDTQREVKKLTLLHKIATTSDENYILSISYINYVGFIGLII